MHFQKNKLAAILFSISALIFPVTEGFSQNTDTMDISNLIARGGGGGGDHGGGGERGGGGGRAGGASGHSGGERSGGGHGNWNGSGHQHGGNNWNHHGGDWNNHGGNWNHHNNWNNNGWYGGYGGYGGGVNVVVPGYPEVYDNGGVYYDTQDVYDEDNQGDYNDGDDDLVQ